VLSTAHDVADGRLLRVVEALQEAGLSVEVIGRGDAAQGPAGATVRTVRRRGSGGLTGLAARSADAVIQPLRARGTVLMTLTPDPLPGAALRRLLGRGPYVADCQEDYLALLADRSWAHGPAGVAARGLARAARTVAARADVTVVADDHVPPKLARRRVVVTNLPSASYLPEPAPPAAHPRAIYVGDVRQSRGLRTMLEALELAPRWRLDIVGPVSRQDQPWLDQWTETSPAADRLTVHGRLAPGPAWALAAGAWVGLALLDSTPAFVDAIPSKVYEYLACGLPALVTPLPRAAALISDTGAGEVVRDGAQAARVLESYVDDPQRLALQRDAAVAWSAKQSSEPSAYDALARDVRLLVARSGAPR
jgi:glycosyltransferase involved in cell wall biosynthesis